jgi:hypothetical protein
MAGYPESLVFVDGGTSIDYGYDNGGRPLNS